MTEHPRSDGSTLRSTQAASLNEAEPDQATAAFSAPAARYTLRAPPLLGGMGEVYLAHDAVLDGPVALKLLAERYAEAPAAAARFQAEARLTARLAHPSIVPVHDIGRWHDGRPYYTMRWEAGPRLDTRITALHKACCASDPPAWRSDPDGYSLRRLLELLTAVCDAAAHAHDRGVVHRDLKPTNVVVSGPGQVALLDWGLAWSSEWGEEGLGRACGTPGYAAPEQLRAEAQPDPGWDVYALGATLTTILCGDRPYGHGAPLHAALAGPPAPVTERTALPLDPGLVEIAERAMAAPPERYPHARALAEALRGWLDGDARRARGLQVVAEADALLHELEKIRARNTAQLEAVNQQISEISAWAPEASWRMVWAVQDEATALQRALSLGEVQLMERLRAALAHDPDLPEARDRLARTYQALHQSAERAGRREEASRWEPLIREHDRGALAAYLRGDGRLSLETDPPGAEVWAARYELQDRRLVPGPAHRIGTTPIVETTLPMGSWLLTLRAPGRAPVRYPVLITRLGRWPDPPAGEPDPGPVYLPRPDELGEHDRYVPAGYFLAGGDPLAPRQDASYRRWADGFVLRRDPVTIEEYLAFLNDQAARGALDPALEPRERSTAGLGERLLGWDGQRFTLERGGGRPPWHPRRPVTHIRADAAEAYATWLGAREGLPWQLPLSTWMEKAARGVDGRFFPMGDTMIGAWSWTRDSAADPPDAAPVDALRQDESPYGVSGLSGNVRSWCADREGDANVRVRGGSWTYPTDSCRAAGRMWHTPDTRLENLGLRLARRLPQ